MLVYDDAWKSTPLPTIFKRHNVFQSDPIWLWHLTLGVFIPLMSFRIFLQVSLLFSANKQVVNCSSKTFHVLTRHKTRYLYLAFHLWCRLFYFRRKEESYLCPANSQRSETKSLHVNGSSIINFIDMESVQKLWCSDLWSIVLSVLIFV